jgi:hypothetical protein
VRVDRRERRRHASKWRRTRLRVWALKFGREFSPGPGWKRNAPRPRPKETLLRRNDGHFGVRCPKHFTAPYPVFVPIHVFRADALQYRAKQAREWLARPGAGSSCSCPCWMMNPIKRLWASCTDTSRTIDATPDAGNSRIRRSISCAAKSPRTGILSRLRHGQFSRHRPDSQVTT